MDLRLLPLDRLDRRDIAHWRELAARACEPNPFFAPEFVLPAAATLGRGVALAVVAHKGHWVACMPVRRMRGVGVLRTWCSSYCFLGTPLLDREGTAEAASALLKTGRFVVLERQLASGPAFEAITAALQERGMVTIYEKQHERAALHRRPENDYLDDMRAHRRREFKRQLRRLEEHLGAPLEVHDRSDDPSATDRFIALEASGWKGKAGTAFGSDPAHAAYFRAICDGLRAAGRLHMLELTAGHRTIAMKCNVAAGDGVFCFKIAHDEELGRFSPGVQLEIAYVSRFHEDRTEAWSDSCAAPDNAMINRLWPDRRAMVTWAASRPGAEAMLSRRGVITLTSLRNRERKTPSLSS